MLEKLPLADLQINLIVPCGGLEKLPLAESQINLILLKKNLI